MPFAGRRFAQLQEAAIARMKLALLRCALLVLGLTPACHLRLPRAR